MHLSDKDSELLAQVSKNGKASQRELANKTGMALGTVNSHLKRLEKNKIIKGYLFVFFEDVMDFFFHC